MTYSISVSKPYFGADFYQLLSTIDSPKLQVPYGRAFTFQESILLTCEGALVAPEGRVNIESWIVDRMKEVYGEDCKVVVAEYVATPISADEV